MSGIKNDHAFSLDYNRVIRIEVNETRKDMQGKIFLPNRKNTRRQLGFARRCEMEGTVFLILIILT